jgi:hypothetical protein
MSIDGARSTTANARTVPWLTRRQRSSRHPRAMEIWKAKNAFHIPTAPTTTTTGYTRHQTKTGKFQLSLDEKNGAGHTYQGFSTNDFSGLADNDWVSVNGWLFPASSSTSLPTIVPQTIVLKANGIY